MKSDKNLKRRFERDFRNHTLELIVEKNKPENAAKMIVLMQKDKVSLDILREFLVLHQDKLDPDNKCYPSDFKKLVCFYDHLKYGW